MTTLIHKNTPRRAIAPLRLTRHRRPARSLLEMLESRLLLSATDPTGQEQQLLWLLNRMRTAPAAELNLLLNNSDFYVQQALSYFNVDLNLLATQWTSLTPAQPVAWDANLATAAAGHNDAMAQADQQSHQLPGEPSPGDRITNAGYNFSAAGENVYAFAASMVHAHAGFAIDWGNAPGGIQDPPAHRIDMMDNTYRDVGIGVLQATGVNTGPYLVTQDFAAPMVAGDSDLVGTIYSDTNADGAYDPGEGLAGVTVTAVGDAGVFHATSRTAGGYQMVLPNGTYAISFSGGNGQTLLPSGSFAVTINSQNALLDALATSPPPVKSPPPAASSTATPVGSVDVINKSASGSPTSIFGWASDVDADANGAGPVQVRLDIDGNPGTPITANLPRADLLPVLGSTDHGFLLTVPPLSSGKHTLSVVALDIPTGAATPIFQSTVSVTSTVFGFVDQLTSSGINGWAFDPNLGGLPAQVQVNVDGVAVENGSATGFRGDLISVVGDPNHGFTLPFPTLTIGTHKIDVFAIGASGKPVLLASQSVSTGGTPRGSLDLADATSIAGWAMDPDTPAASINVRVDIDGSPFSTFAASAPRADLSVIGSGNYAFDIATPVLPAGNHTVSLFAIDVPTGLPVLIGTRNFAVASGGSGNVMPVGAVDVLTRTEVVGWAVDRNDLSTAVQIRVTVDGIALPLIAASVVRLDLGPVFGSTLHGYNITLSTLTTGPHLVQVFALDVETQTAVLLGGATV